MGFNKQRNSHTSVPVVQSLIRTSPGQFHPKGLLRVNPGLELIGPRSFRQSTERKLALGQHSVIL